MNRHPRRRMEVLLAIEYAWEKNPELRLGQLLINAVRPPDSDLFYVEDEELVKALGLYSSQPSLTSGDEGTSR